MRLLTLELLAFGPFSGRVLDLSRPGLQLVHGPNEAGKSTARRALQGLLYGIPERTTDAHRHEPRQLRVGARLAAADGSELHLVRRKGRKRTLLDPDGEPVDEALLTALLRGVSEERFASTFCLDHETLRQGGEHLRQALGDVGESLFDAGLGGGGVHQVLARLREEADGLFAPRASKPLVNRALAAFKAAGKRRRELELSGAEVQAVRREQRALTERRHELAERRAGLVDALARLRRAAAVLPLLIQHDEASQRRAALGEVPALDDDAPARRQAAQDARREARAAGQVQAAALERLQGQLDALGELPDDELVDPDELEELDRQLARHVTALADRTKLQRRLDEQEAELTRVLEALGDGRPLAEAGALVLEDGLVRRVRELVRRRGELHSTEAHCRRQLDQARQRQEQLERDAVQAPDPVARATLATALALVDDLGDVGDRLRRLDEQRRQGHDRLRAAFAALEPRAATIEQTLELGAPDRETLGRLADKLADLGRRDEHLGARRDEGRARREEAAARLARDEQAGAVPERDDLTRAREQRDERWRGLREGGDPSGPEGQAFERLQAAADELADRLVDDAERVQRRAALRDELTRADRALASLADEQRQLDAERQDLAARWQELWAPTGLEAGPPADRRPWREALAALELAAGAARAADEERADAVARVEAVLDQLRQALEPWDEPLPDRGRLAPDLELAAVVERARARAAALDDQQRAADQQGQAALQAEQDIREAAEVLAAAETDLAAWAAAWAQALEPLGLPSGASAEQVEQQLDWREALSRAWDRRAESSQRLAGMDDDERALDERLTRLEAGWSAADPDQPAEQRARSLLAWQTALRQARQQREGLVQRLEQARAELEQSRAQERRADAELEEACVAARCESVDELPALERRVIRARELDEQLVGLAEQLALAGDGADLESLRVLCEGLEQAALGQALQEHEQQLESLDEELREVDGQLVRVAGQLDAGSGPSAADLALEAEGHLAEIRGGARRWATLRLAAVLLEQEIERFREAHQGPVLQRVGELFPRLTDGRYQRVRAEPDDDGRPQLLVSREAGEWLDVAALSDGTRDQLFLALKVATLERQARADEPFPLVVDDVLVHFDDRRTALALEVLGELAEATQVLLFTHHERVAELARQALPADRLAEHALTVEDGAG